MPRASLVVRSSRPYRLYRRLGRARERDVPPTVWQLRHYWHFCRNCAGWPDGPPSQWRFTRASPELVLCQACVGFARIECPASRRPSKQTGDRLGRAAGRRLSTAVGPCALGSITCPSSILRQPAHMCKPCPRTYVDHVSGLDTPQGRGVMKWRGLGVPGALYQGHLVGTTASRHFGTH